MTDQNPINDLLQQQLIWNAFEFNLLALDMHRAVQDALEGEKNWLANTSKKKKKNQHSLWIIHLTSYILQKNYFHGKFSSFSAVTLTYVSESYKYEGATC